MQFLDNDVLYDPYEIQTVRIYDAAVGGTLITSLTPQKSSVGEYYVDWSIPEEEETGTYWDEWTYKALLTMDYDVVRATFIVGGPFTVAPTFNTQSLENRLVTLASAINSIQNALNAVPSKREVLAWNAVIQGLIRDLENELETHIQVGHS
jgi:hypothetical protein